MKKYFLLFCYIILCSLSFSHEIYRDRMKEFIRELRENTAKEKIFITQNGNELYFKNGKLDFDFFPVTDGTTQESLYYGHELHLSRATPSKFKKELLSFLIPIQKEGKTVFNINYGEGENRRAKIAEENEKFGFIGELLPVFEANKGYTPIKSFHKEDISSLKEAKNFLCLLNPEKFKNLKEYREYLENKDYDVLLIEPSLNGEFFTREDIESLKRKTSGGRRLVIAYFSIGEAENYRYYWKKSWNKKRPDWMVEENENWKGNYIVKYWVPEWKSIIKNYQKKLDEIGVDGYLLDTVDSYYYFEDKEEEKKGKK
ncbi:endo alpha-1,4 polygalactosaminidase [Fusobacterium necrophorum]|uniref:endo alpha-1,4 polygalactosaminidase n=1 Tax=Fusobacterium necrophorum TaxID=859 RepID=UPI00088E491F|nr:endo alpha-1,4 polygalactosaminidase [Fusobacterium necrophorum]AYZ72730.1 endo alpha-1,4 polygalactosaminidase [Fusobacterium necrophorum]AZW09275.1 endo alpha-1,4 polygalactosaminidase [Fusobacterium necrophorum subsp. necrophorum]SDB36675.1 cysteinyl-tRNA synthetase, unknown class [Fusobacterium necrophorum]SQD10314.1 Uncharacterized conserved protein [Fusobacterium necrophorum subsp. necrophorum]